MMTNRASKTLAVAVSLSFAALTGAAQAASDGNLGADSTGTSDITIIKDNFVQITGVADIDLGSENLLTANKVGSDGVCVFASSTQYRVTVTPLRTIFALEAGTGNSQIVYNVTWTDGVVPVPLPVVAGVASTPFTGDPLSANCGGSDNATFEVSVDAATFNAATAGTYTDTLTLFIESI